MITATAKTMQTASRKSTLPIKIQYKIHGRKPVTYAIGNLPQRRAIRALGSTPRSWPRPRPGLVQQSSTATGSSSTPSPAAIRRPGTLRSLRSSGPGGRSPLGDERRAGGGEAVAVVEDVAAHLGELPDAVGLERLAPLVGRPRCRLRVEQAALVVGGRPARRRAPRTASSNSSGARGSTSSTSPIRRRLGGADRQALLGERSAAAARRPGGAARRSSTPSRTGPSSGSAG